jgi:hypothetical protein
MVECKASKTVHPGMAAPLRSLRRSMSAKTSVPMAVVHRPSASASASGALAPGVEAVDVTQFVAALNGGRRRPRRK